MLVAKIKVNGLFLITAVVLLCATPSIAVAVDLPPTNNVAVMYGADAQVDVVPFFASAASSTEEGKSFLATDDARNLESDDFKFQGDSEDIDDVEDLEDVFDEKERDSLNDFEDDEDELEDDGSEQGGNSAGPKMTVIVQDASLNSGSEPYRPCTRSELLSLEGSRPQQCLVFYDFMI